MNISTMLRNEILSVVSCCKYISLCLTFLYSNAILQLLAQSTNDPEFNPSITARCDRGMMNIMIVTKSPFNGAAHTRDFRRSPCVVYGNGSLTTILSINLLANSNDKKYCGAHKLKGSEEITVAIAVRPHKALELSDDKYFLITCAQSGFRNARNEFSRVSLKFFDTKGQKVSRLVHGNPYTFRAEISSPNEYGLQIRSCYSFAANTTEVELLNADGCPTTNLLSSFSSNNTHIAEATIYSMFKFPDVTKMHIQCDIILCKGGCPDPRCNGERTVKGLANKGLANNETLNGTISLLASTTAHVIEPGDEILALANLQECTEWRFPWLITLCICLAILLLIMLLLNIFLCSSLSCSCVKTEVDEKEPSDIEDYDPYKVDWSPHSHYGSKTSLNKHGYASGGSTANSRSYSGNESDNYARPQSRYSAHSNRSNRSAHIDPHVHHNNHVSHNHYRKY